MRVAVTRAVRPVRRVTVVASQRAQVRSEEREGVERVEVVGITMMVVEVEFLAWPVHTELFLRSELGTARSLGGRAGKVALPSVHCRQQQQLKQSLRVTIQRC